MRLLITLVAVVTAAALAPATGSAAPRMYTGFQDDPSFRWNEGREQALDLAKEANSTILRTTLYWHRIAPTRPALAIDAFDPAYRFDDLDEFVRNAQKRDMEVMLTIWGTPGWANGGKGFNRLPTRLSDLTAFARAVATRYSGRYIGYPYVRFYSVWNEPNLQQFLAPQYDSRGRSVSPRLYAALYRAAYAGLKAGNPTVRIAIGETSARGRDKKIGIIGLQQTHSPGKFAALLALQRPALRFDAWGHHPYPTDRMHPTQRLRWPSVGLSSLPRFGVELDKWFKRKNIPIWITEYAHQTEPSPLGVPKATQAVYLSQALSIARANPRVGMFIWFVMKDHTNTPWQSGVVEETGAKKPSFARFATIARAVDARNPIFTVTSRGPIVRVPALSLAYQSARGAKIGITYRVYDRGRLIEVEQPQVQLGVDGWFSFRTRFTPQVGRSYVVRVEAGDINGNGVIRSITLVRPKPLVAPRPAPRAPTRNR